MMNRAFATRFESSSSRQTALRKAEWTEVDCSRRHASMVSPVCPFQDLSCTLLGLPTCRWTLSTHIRDCKEFMVHICREMFDPECRPEMESTRGVAQV